MPKKMVNKPLAKMLEKFLATSFKHKKCSYIYKEFV